MAGGLGTRMRSALPKHLHPLLGRRMLDWVLAAASPLEPRPSVVVSSPATVDELRATLPREIELVVQAEARGTGDAVAAARSALEDFEGDILVLSGDTPLLTTEVLRDLVAEHRRDGAAVTVLSIEPPEPLPYGRLLRDESGALRAIVEASDATPAELAVRELNSSIYVFSSGDLWTALGRLRPDNVQGELYLTDTVRALVDAGRRAAVYPAPDSMVAHGVNTRAELAVAADCLRARVNEAHMLAGVTIVDPRSTWIEADVELEADVVVQPFTFLRGRTRVAAGAEIGSHVVAVDATIGPEASVGPFCYLRAGTVLHTRTKAGTFVEIKNAQIGARTKVPHLSYIGDAEIGEQTNIAAGNITANYPHEPGLPKGKTKIGNNVRTGVQNAFDAPVEVGDNAWIAAGSVVTDDVPPGALAIARARQVNKEGYADAKRND